MSLCDVGLIGLAVMGENLAKNFARNLFKVAIYNRTGEVTRRLMAENSSLTKQMVACYDLKELVGQLKTPRKIIIMVKAGDALDRVIEQLLPYLTREDIIIDGGNSYYRDTNRRFKFLYDKSIHYVGMGVSGGEKGALLGPSLMPGGLEKVVMQLLPMLKKVAAQHPVPCVYYMGGEGAGHFVKMVHNGIEYAEMQIIAEVYDIFRKIFDYDNEKIASIFKDYQTSDLNSYLLGITIKILQRKDDQLDLYLVDLILDEAQGKGTGKWTIMESLEYGSPVPSIYGAYCARNISAHRLLRKQISSLYNKKIIPKIPSVNLLDIVKDAMRASKILAYTQGLNLIVEASQINKWKTNLTDVISSWCDGCIIRCAMLDPMITALGENSNLLLTREFSGILKESIIPLKQTLFLGLEAGVATPAMSGAAWYFEYFSETVMPTNLIQAQRDYFGAHTYRRTDRDGIFHTVWE